MKRGEAKKGPEQGRIAILALYRIRRVTGPKRRSAALGGWQAG